ncbi:MAG: Integral rane protein [Armatimonadetes bacterium]|nr:Integral rane protein [Armatimonadota bacterium]
MKNEHRVLTPESVEFVYELGGLGSRMVAAFIDHAILALVLTTLWLVGCVLIIPAMAFAGVIASAAIVGTFALYFGYFAYFEWRWNGQTPGKRAMDLRVIDDRGMNIDAFQALTRNLFRIVDMMPFLFAADFLAFGFYAFGGIAAWLSPRQKRLGDWAAGTLVVRTRKRVMPSAIIAPNEKYNTLQEDLSLRHRIRRSLSLDERELLLQLCLRRNELEFEGRQALFADASALLEERLEITREPFMSEEKFVQNIVAVALDETRGALVDASRSR